jgi:hypothetical protein
MLRAILPAFAILIVLGIAFSFVVMGALIGGIAAAGAGYDFSNLPASSFGMTFLFIYMIIVLFLAAFIQTRTILPFSVLYSELTGYNNNDQNDQEKTPVAVPENVIVTDPEENTNKEEEKKEEPEIPYEQRYMPR